MNWGDNISRRITMSEPTEKQYYVSSKSRNVAIILACMGFLGFSGFHRLYVGKTLSGIIYVITGGVFFVGTLYDLYALCSESFKDAEGFPLYSDSSMKSNYHRRTLKKKTGFVAWVFVVIWGFFILSSFTFGLTHDNQDSINNTAQEEFKKNSSTKNNKRKEEIRPVLDVDMSGRPAENIVNTVKANILENSIAELKYIDADVDASSGKAKVTVRLHGARGLTINGTLGVFDEAAKQIIAALYQVNPGIEIENVKVIIEMPIVHRDTGAEESIPSYSLSMSENKAKQMHWDNYKNIDMYEAADKVEIHPYLQAEIKKNAGKSALEETFDTIGENIK